MSDQTPEVCALCDRAATGSYNASWTLASSAQDRMVPVCDDHNPFRPAEPTPAECAVCGKPLTDSPYDRDALCFGKTGNLVGHQTWRASTPAERPEGEWRRVGEGPSWGSDQPSVQLAVWEQNVAPYTWRSETIPLSLERAISSAAVAEYERREDGLRGNLQFQIERAQAAERALEEAREAARTVLDEIPECIVRETSTDHTEVCETHRWVLPCPYARLRALVSTEGEATS